MPVFDTKRASVTVRSVTQFAVLSLWFSSPSGLTWMAREAGPAAAPRRRGAAYPAGAQAGADAAVILGRVG